MGKPNLTKDNRTKPVKCTILAAILWISIGLKTHGQITPPYAYTINDEASASDAPLSQEVYATGFFSVTNFQAVVASDSCAVLCDGGVGSFSGSVINGQLIGFCGAGIASGVPGPPGYGDGPFYQEPNGTWYGLGEGSYQGAASGDLAFYDTFYISGPANQTGEFQVTLSFQGNNLTEQTLAEAANDDAVFYVSLFYNGVYTGWGSTSGSSLISFAIPLVPWYTLPTTQTQSTTVSAQSGSSMVLEIAMFMRAYLIQPNLYGGHLIDEWGSAYMTITPLTSGFSFTTASGLSYASAPVPPFSPAANLSMGGTNVSLSFATQTNHIYWVSYKTNLSDASWNILPGSSLLGDGTTKTVVDQMQVSQRFYRVSAL